MAITRKDVEYVAHLSRIEITGEEAARFTEQLEKIVSYVDKLGEVDVSGVDPLAFAAEAGNVVREDSPADSLTPAEALRNAPQAAGGFFRVPQVIE